MMVVHMSAGSMPPRPQRCGAERPDGKYAGAGPQLLVWQRVCAGDVFLPSHRCKVLKVVPVKETQSLELAWQVGGGEVWGGNGESVCVRVCLGRRGGAGAWHSWGFQHCRE